MNVVFCIEKFFPHAAGAAYAAKNIARGLRDKGVGVSFIVDDFGGDYRNGGTYDGFPVWSFQTGHPGKVRRIMGFAHFLIHIIRMRDRFDLFHIHGGNYITLAQGTLAQALGKTALLKVTHDVWDTPANVRATRHGRAAWFAYRRLNGVVGMSSGQVAKIRSQGYTGQIAHIPNGVDCQHFRPLEAGERTRVRRSLGIPENAQLLVYAGTLGEHKGTDTLFRVWSRLLSAGIDASLLCTGNFGSELTTRSEIRGFLQQQNLPSALADDARLYLTGRTADMAVHLGAGDVFVFPSRAEGFGTVQIEAMACGLPCVVNDLPGLSEDIFPGSSFGFRVVGNGENMAATLTMLLKDDALRQRVGHAARSRAVECFSIDAVVSRYIQFYRELLNRPLRDRQS